MIISDFFTLFDNMLKKSRFSVKEYNTSGNSNICPKVVLISCIYCFYMTFFVSVHVQRILRFDNAIY